MPNNFIKELEDRLKGIAEIHDTKIMEGFYINIEVKNTSSFDSWEIGGICCRLAKSNCTQYPKVIPLTVNNEWIKLVFLASPINLETITKIINDSHLPGTIKENEVIDLSNVL